MTERNPVNHKKLPGSKWTATQPQKLEKHFMVHDWVLDEDGRPTEMVHMEAILTGRRFQLHWRELADRDHWRVGWL